MIFRYSGEAGYYFSKHDATLLIQTQTYGNTLETYCICLQTRLFHDTIELLQQDPEVCPDSQRASGRAKMTMMKNKEDHDDDVDGDEDKDDDDDDDDDDDCYYYCYFMMMMMMMMTMMMMMMMVVVVVVVVILKPCKNS